MLAHQKNYYYIQNCQKWDENEKSYYTYPTIMNGSCCCCCCFTTTWMNAQTVTKTKYLTGMGNCFKNLYKIFFYIWKKAYKLTLPKGERGVSSVRAMIYFQVEELHPFSFVHLCTSWWAHVPVFATPMPFWLSNGQLQLCMISGTTSYWTTTCLLCMISRTTKLLNHNLVS